MNPIESIDLESDRLSEPQLEALTRPVPGIRKPYFYDQDLVSAANALDTGDVTLVQQQFLEEADINTIMRRYGQTGVAPLAKSPPEYGDFRGINDFQTAMLEMQIAKESFAALPALVRDRFANDPARLIAFLGDEGNLDEARKLGLVPPAAPPAPIPPDPAPKGQVDDPA